MSDGPTLEETAIRVPETPFWYTSPLVTPRVEWWTRSQRIRTAAEFPFEVALVGADLPPLYQRIAREAQQLGDLGLNRHRIAQKLGVADKTVAKAISWQRSILDQG